MNSCIQYVKNNNLSMQIMKRIKTPSACKGCKGLKASQVLYNFSANWKTILGDNLVNVVKSFFRLNSAKKKANCT